jgi:hypothetical protein
VCFFDKRNGKKWIGTCAKTKGLADEDEGIVDGI